MKFPGKLSIALILILLMTVFAAMPDRITTSAQSTPAFIKEARVIEMDDAGITNPAGLVYHPNANTFLVMEGKKRGQSTTELISLSPFAESAGSARIAAAIRDPRNMAFDPYNNRLLIFQSPANRLVVVKFRADGTLNPRSLTGYDARHFGLKNPQGLAVDPEDGTLFFLDANAPRLVRVQPEPDGSVDKAVVSVVNLRAAGLADVKGIAIDPTTGHLHVVDNDSLVEMARTGEIVATRDLSEFGIRNPQGMAFAPSGDLTDNQAETSLYVTDQGDTTAPTTGGIVELSFIAAAEPLAATAAGTLIRTIDTSRFSPPSPDPSGIAFLPASGTLMIGDGEVDEMSNLFTGDNLFESTTTGSLIDSLSATAFSDEPVGMDVNPINKHLFISDDTGTRMVYELNPGSDGRYRTADDQVTSMPTGPFGSKDPEGVAFDPSGSGVLYIMDGANREVYRVAPGPNGLFDGIGDQVTHFDTLSLGLDDPEGIAFNALSGTLYAVGKPAGTLWELTTSGAVVRTINISSINARKPAGLALGPSSVDPGQLSIYIAARGVDNDSNPNENDGKVYEVAVGIALASPSPTPSPGPSNTPTITPTPTATPNPTLTPTATSSPTPGPSPTLTHTPTVTPSLTSTNTPTVTPTATITPSPTNTQASTVLTLGSAADARVIQASPDTNYGTSTRLDVDSPGEESYIRFTVSGLAGPVQSAILRLYVTNGTSNGPSIYQANSSWTESGITWNNRPAPIGGAVANLGSAAAGTWAEFNLSSVITSDGTYDFVLRPDSTSGITLTSKEGTAANRPQLVLTLGSGSSQPPSPTPTATTEPQAGGVILVGAGDIANCSSSGDEQTALLLDSISGTVFTIGDNVYPNGSAADFTNCYTPNWGRHKDRTYPAVGDNDYKTTGASGYFNYFGAAAGDPTKGYYSYDLGGWHIITLNSNCSEVGGCNPSSPQGQWLQADLATHATACTLAILHEPLFSSNGGDLDLRDFWAPLYAAGAEIVLGGHRHNYERFELQNPDGAADPGRGIRQFVVGTGGSDHSTFDGIPAPNSQVRNDNTYGVLKLTLYPGSYEWQFIPVSGGTFTDSGSAQCVTP